MFSLASLVIIASSELLREHLIAIVIMERSSLLHSADKVSSRNKTLLFASIADYVDRVEI